MLFIIIIIVTVIITIIIGPLKYTCTTYFSSFSEGWKRFPKIWDSCCVNIDIAAMILLWFS